MYKYVILTLLNDVIAFLTSLKCSYNVTQVIYTVFFQFQIPIIRQKSFVSPAPWGQGIAGLLTFHFLKPNCGAKFVVKFLLNAPPPEVDNNDNFIHHDELLQGNLAVGPELFGQKLDRAFLLTYYSGSRVGFPCLTTIHMKDTFNPGSL